MTPDARTRALHYSLRFATALAIVVIPVLLVTSSLRFAINAGGLYEYDFDRYNISLRTGIPNPELSRIGEEIRDYFNDDSELIDIDAVIYGEVQPLFTEREIIHMKDVKGLIHVVYMWQWISLGYLAACMAGYAWLRRRGAIPGMVRVGFWGGVVTLLIIGALGLGSLVGFEALFLKFHQLSFANDLWRLNPRIHNLIAMFPEPFFRDATLLVALMAIGQALLLVCVGLGDRLSSRFSMQRERAAGSGPQ